MEWTSQITIFNLFDGKAESKFMVQIELEN